jgi:hypothetical protein
MNILSMNDPKLRAETRVMDMIIASKLLSNHNDQDVSSKAKDVLKFLNLDQTPVVSRGDMKTYASNRERYDAWTESKDYKDALLRYANYIQRVMRPIKETDQDAIGYDGGVRHEGINYGYGLSKADSDQIKKDNTIKDPALELKSKKDQRVDPNYTYDYLFGSRAASPDAVADDGEADDNDDTTDEYIQRLKKGSGAQKAKKQANKRLADKRLEVKAKMSSWQNSAIYHKRVPAPAPVHNVHRWGITAAHILGLNPALDAAA